MCLPVYCCATARASPCFLGQLYPLFEPQKNQYLSVLPLVVSKREPKKRRSLPQKTMRGSCCSATVYADAHTLFASFYTVSIWTVDIWHNFVPNSNFPDTSRDENTPIEYAPPRILLRYSKSLALFFGAVISFFWAPFLTQLKAKR